MVCRCLSLCWSSRLRSIATMSKAAAGTELATLSSLHQTFQVTQTEAMASLSRCHYTKMGLGISNCQHRWRLQWMPDPLLCLHPPLGQGDFPHALFCLMSSKMLHCVLAEAGSNPMTGSHASLRICKYPVPICLCCLRLAFVPRGHHCCTPQGFD